VSPTIITSGDQAPRAQTTVRERVLSITLWAAAGAMVILLVALLLDTFPSISTVFSPTATPTPETIQATKTTPVDPSTVPAAYSSKRTLVRALNPYTDMEQDIRREAINYTVEEGDSLFALSKKFNLEPETVFWANYEKLGGSPDAIKPGIEMVIPPSDGVLYEWKEGDTLQSVADKYKVKPEAILEATFNKIDLTNPSFSAGEYVMIPGGKGESVSFFSGEIPRGSAGTLARVMGDGGCDTSAGGAVGDGSFGNPVPGGVVIGNDYIGGVHQGVDLGSSSSNTVVAADSGVVVYSGWANGGYGITVVIDHGNGFQTLYAHLSTTTVGCGASVGQGTQIGVVGSTGNSTGPHLHFEIRYMGLNDNPHNYF